MATAKVDHRFTVSQVEFLENVPTRINVKKRREYVSFHPTTSEDNINIMYLDGQTSSADKNMSISDRSTSLVQNRIPELGDILTVTGATFDIGVDQFLVTDQFTEETPTQPAVPLFFAHTLAGFNAALADIDNRVLVSLEFLDQNFEAVAFSEYIIDTESPTLKGKLFNNIENTFNSRTQAADVRLVKYTVKTFDDEGNATIEAFHELINNEPIFRIAEFSDVDEFGILDPNVNAYLIAQTGTGFTVTMPRSTTYAYRESPDSRIKVLLPASPAITDPWFVRITNGRFLTTLPSTPEINIGYEYGIAEFNSQTFDPLPPYRSQTGEQAYRVSARIIQVAKNIAYLPDTSLYVNVVVRDEFGDLKYAFSNDPNNVGRPYSNTDVTYEDGIVSLDARNGFIELLYDIEATDVSTVSYYTEEKQFQFTAVDCNPTNNLDILNQRLVLYVNPERSSDDLDQSLFYLIVDPIGRIQYCSQPEENSGGIDPATVKMLAEDFGSDGFPLHTFYYDKPSTTAGLASRISEGTGLDDVEDFSFIDKYTVESQLFSFTTVTGDFRKNFIDNPKLLVLADISVGESQRSSGYTDFDVRKRGGGIKTTNFQDALEEQSEIAWFWDQIQLRPYPATTAFYVEVPQSVLSENGGRFSRPDLTAAIERHMQFGGYAVIRSYGVDPTINWATVTSGAFSVAWPSYGADKTYDVYYSTALDGVYEKDNDNVIQDVPSGNFYMASGLNAATNYFVRVRAWDGNEYSLGPAVRLTTASGLEEEP